MDCFKKSRGASRDGEYTQVHVKTDEFMTVANMRQEFLRMRSTNSHLKDCVRVLHQNNEKMRREALDQQMEAREAKMKGDACSVVQEVMSHALAKIVAEKDQEATMKESMLSQTKEELACSRSEAAKFRDEVENLRVGKKDRPTLASFKKLFK
ncbi:uncharacterized protein LOC118425280 isoform X2 [Branchiostoma floridae]|uniref:Uncharacterized protein LOC118425280 isoform X2 n=1 Tax=Branchiostoma floridae TaxID=7739 RepID=A0A9J7N1X9_BRAFL|nr:uncharacterized protein LOC118425280 isoform X2 [Branchiostoma floridae]